MTALESGPTTIYELLGRRGGPEVAVDDRWWTAIALAALDGEAPDWLDRGLMPASADAVGPDVARAWIASGELANAFETHLAERDDGQASGRRNAGAYFTPPALVELVVERTLGPVLAQAATVDDVLSVRVLDPAVGTGVFLVEAARQMAERLARVSAMTETEARAAVVRRCVRGVDANQVSALLTAAALGTFAGDPLAGAQAVRWADFVLPPTTVDLRPGAAPPFASDAWADERPDFDVVIGNPPWGAVKPAIREFLVGAAPSLLDSHGAALRDRVRDLGAHEQRWSAHADEVRAYARTLRTSGWYTHQGRGDADLYRYFVERAHGLLPADDGRLGFVVPSAVLRADGATPLRELLLSTGTVEDLIDFVNTRRLFKIHSMFRFAVVVWQRGAPHGIRRARFGATQVEDGRADAPTVKLSLRFLTDVGGGRLTVPDIATPQDAALLERLYRAQPMLGDDASRRLPVRFVRELDMTNDSSSFVPARDALAEGYVPLYEGRMVHQHDDRAKFFVGGSGRRAEWAPQPQGTRRIAPQYYVADEVADRASPRRARAAFCDVTGHANERSLLAAMVPPHAVAGNKVPTVRIGVDDDIDDHLVWLAIANSFVVDWIARRRIATSLNFFHLNQFPFPDLDPGDRRRARLADLARCLSETVDWWDEATLHRRAFQRADIDAIVVSLFGLGLEDVAHLLDDFPLLDRHQPRSPVGPRSTITRDLLLSVCARENSEHVDDVRVLGLEPQSGPTDLDERVASALAAGQIAYLPAEAAKCLWRSPMRG